MKRREAGQLDGTIIVTGAAGALGRGVAERLAADGWRLVAIGRGEAEALPACAAQRLGGVDLTDEAAAERAFAGLGAAGSIRGLVNIAGGFAWEKIAGGSTATWDRLYTTNVATALNASKAAIPLLGRGGAIVNVGAAAAARAEVG